MSSFLFRRMKKKSISPRLIEAGPLLNLREGEIVILTYTSAADKRKIFSVFIREGINNGDRIFYVYPDEESEIVRDVLIKHGIDVNKYEKNGTLFMRSLTEHFMLDGKFNKEKAVSAVLDFWNETKRKGYKHIRHIEDVGDFSFLKGQWQKYITDYWYDPRWSDPDEFPKWVKSLEPVGTVYTPFIMEITAINVEVMTEQQVSDILKTFGKGTTAQAKFIDLFENINIFSGAIDLNHQQLLGRKILLEFDPISNYEKIVDSFAKEAIANVEPIFVFTSSASVIHSCLAKHPGVKSFLMSAFTSTLKSTSENEILLPANNISLILDTLSKVLENYADANVCLVFDVLSELLISVGLEKTFTFLRYALDTLASEKVTALFLLNPSAHEPQVVSSLKGLFSNQLAYGKNGLEAARVS